MLLGRQGSVLRNTAQALLACCCCRYLFVAVEEAVSTLLYSVVSCPVTMRCVSADARGRTKKTKSHKNCRQVMTSRLGLVHWDQIGGEQLRES